MGRRADVNSVSFAGESTFEVEEEVENPKTLARVCFLLEPAVVSRAAWRPVSFPIEGASILEEMGFLMTRPPLDVRRLISGDEDGDESRALFETERNIQERGEVG